MKEQNKKEPETPKKSKKKARNAPKPKEAEENKWQDFLRRHSKPEQKKN